VTDWSTVADTDASVELFFGYADGEAYASCVEQLVDDAVASSIANQDPTLWGPEAQEESAKRLAWVDLAEGSRALVPEIEQLRSRLHGQGVDHVVLCGMGGSSLAPEVICASAGVELTVLDSSDPDYVRRAVEDRLASTVVVVSSKSGSTVETDSQRRAYEKAFGDAGIDATERIVVVTDPGSPLDSQAREAGYTVLNADPNVGGRYSALTAFGLVPSGLAGVDLTTLLDEAAAVQVGLGVDSAENSALRLGALLGLAATRGVDKLVLADAGSPTPGLGDWIEQLVAESTGKNGRGLLPVVVEGVDAPNLNPSTADSVLVTYGPQHVFDSVPPSSGWGATVDAPLGAQMLLWEYAVAVAGRVIGINPFDQPDVESAKEAARGMLEQQSDPAVPLFSDGAVEVHATDGLLDGSDQSVSAAVQALLGHLDADTGYLAVMAYLDRGADASLARLRTDLARRTGRPVTWVGDRAFCTRPASTTRADRRAVSTCR
jgi:glucose-6-phosphate isomerase